MDLRNQALDIYFYNGFEEPELLGNSIQDFIDNDVRITQGFGILNVEVGDLTELVIEQLEWYLKGKIYTDELEFNIFVDPTLEDFIEENKRCNLPPMSYLESYEFQEALEGNEKRTVCIDNWKQRNPSFN